MQSSEHDLRECDPRECSDPTECDPRECSDLAQSIASECTDLAQSITSASNTSSTTTSQIPQFISKTPWYIAHSTTVNSTRTDLNHQTHQTLHDEPSAKKKQIATFDEKRDRWSGYQPDQYIEIIENWTEKPQQKEPEPPAVEKRSRKDVAAYLKAGETASYDPKTRSSRLKGNGFVGEGFVAAAAAGKQEKECIFAWEAEKRIESANAEEKEEFPVLSSAAVTVDLEEQQRSLKRSLLEKFQ